MTRFWCRLQVHPMSTPPNSIVLSFAGLFATTVLVIGATVVRPRPLPDAESVLSGTKTTEIRKSDDTSAKSDKKKDKDEDEAPKRDTDDDPAPSTSNEAREAREKFQRNVQARRYKSAIEELTSLLENDPGAARDSDTRKAIVELSMRVMLMQGPEPNMVFGLICQRMGTTGLDILYELLTTRGGSRAAKRAEELLKDEKIRSKGSDAMQVAYALRTSRGCDEKKSLFDRAKKYGDNRTLGQLHLLNRSCGRRSGDCCLHKDPELEATIDAIKARGD